MSKKFFMPSRSCLDHCRHLGSFNNSPGSESYCRLGLEKDAHIWEPCDRHEYEKCTVCGSRDVVFYAGGDRSKGRCFDHAGVE